MNWSLMPGRMFSFQLRTRRREMLSTTPCVYGLMYEAHWLLQSPAGPATAWFALPTAGWAYPIAVPAPCWAVGTTPWVVWTAWLNCGCHEPTLLRALLMPPHWSPVSPATD